MQATNNARKQKQRMRGEYQGVQNFICNYFFSGIFYGNFQASNAALLLLQSVT